MYSSHKIEKEPSLFEVEVGLKLSLTCLLSIQLVFQLFTIAYIQCISYFQASVNLHSFSPRGLSNFAWDMWLITILLSFSLVGYSILKKVKTFPLYLLSVYPATLIIFSLMRDVALIQVAVLASLAYVIIFQVNYKRIKQFEISEV